MQLPECVMDELAKNRKLGIEERGIYLLAWNHDPSTIAGLAELANMNRNRAARACRRLAEQDLMKLIKHPTGTRPSALIPESCQLVMAHDFQEEYLMAPWRGEFLARTRVDWHLVLGDYICNARPAFLENPKTKRPFEYDMYDRKRAFATEYDGSQHYRETSDFKQEDVDTQKVNDLLKGSLSLKNGITLVRFTYKDLRSGILERRLDETVPHLRRGYVDTSGPYAKTVNRVSDAHSAKVEREEKLEKKKAESRANPDSA